MAPSPAAKRALREQKSRFSTSAQSAEQALQSGALVLSDIHNSASFDASGYAVSAGISSSVQRDRQGQVITDAQGTPQTQTSTPGSAGFGSDSGAASSTTVAAISGLAGRQDARTGDQEVGIAPIFDKERVKEEMGAQVAITQAFMPAAAKTWGDVSDQRERNLRRQSAAAAQSGDALRAAALSAEAQRWAEGGAYRAAGHGVIGALGGGAAGALGAGASSLGAPALNALQSQLQAGLQTAGMAPDLALGLAGLTTGGALAALTSSASGGGATGAAAGLGAFNQDLNNRQLHPTEAQLIKDNAKRFARQLYGNEQPSAEQIQAAQALLANTAQNQLDNNLGVTVPYSEVANAFLQTLKIEYQQANGSLTLPGTSGQATGAQQLFFANTEQKNQPWLNQGLADPAITGMVVRTPTTVKPNETTPSNRDRMTGLPLDDKGRYEVPLTVDGKPFAPKYQACATTECMRSAPTWTSATQPRRPTSRRWTRRCSRILGRGRRWARW